MTNSYIFRTEKNPKTIISLISNSTNIPTNLDYFNETISFDLNFFKAKSLVLYNHEGDILAHVLCFNYEPNILYFGFVYSKSKNHLEILINKIIKLASSLGSERIIGPINIPTIIYGWGLMEENSLSSLFVGKPVNPAFYNKTFFKMGFTLFSRHFTWEGSLRNISKEELSAFNYKDYEIVEFDNWEEVKNKRAIFLELNSRNLSPKSRVTPGISQLFDNYLDFIIKYGEPFMFLFLKEKPTNKIIGSINCIPNPLRKNQKGKYDSFVVFSLSIDKKHRNKGLSIFLLLRLAEIALKRDYRYFSTTFEAEIKVTENLAKKFGLSFSRSHIILEFKLDS
jgi:hypothetical protein